MAITSNSHALTPQQIRKHISRTLPKQKLARTLAETASGTSLLDEGQISYGHAQPNTPCRHSIYMYAQLRTQIHSSVKNEDSQGYRKPHKYLYLLLRAGFIPAFKHCISKSLRHFSNGPVGRLRSLASRGATFSPEAVRRIASAASKLTNFATSAWRIVCHQLET